MKYLLFCPGPVNMDENVKKVLLDYDIGHREIEFSELLKSIDSQLMDLVNITHKSQYKSLVISGSSSAANESVISTVLGTTRKMLILKNGEFGNRLFELASHHSNECKYLDFGWGNPIVMSKVEQMIKEHKIDTLAMVHHETSTGMLNDVASISQLVKKYNLLFIVDAVSSVGAEHIEMEKWGIDFLVGATGKAVGAFPGSSFVIGKVSEYKKLKDVKHDTYYLNLWRYFDYMNSKLQTPNTPAVQSFQALDQALKNIHAIGLKNYLEKHIKWVTKLRSVFKELGLQFVIPEAHMSSVLTTIYAPKGISVKTIMSKLREKNIIIYGGKGPMEGKAFQIANIGALTDSDIDYFITSFKDIIRGKSKKS